MSLATFGIIIALSVYVPMFLFYGDEVFSLPDGIAQGCSGFFGCLIKGTADAFNAVGDLFQFVTLSIGDDKIDPTLQTVLRFGLGIVFLIIIIGIIRGSTQS